jgi:hypothetical protein
MMSAFPPPLAGAGGEGACGLYAQTGARLAPSAVASLGASPASGGGWIQFARVQVCVLQTMLITQPLSSAAFGPVMVNEPV